MCGGAGENDDELFMILIGDFTKVLPIQGDKLRGYELASILYSQLV